MKAIKELLQSLLRLFDCDTARRELVEAYLSKSVDTADLEARIKYLTQIGYI